MLYSLYYSYNGHLTYPHLKFWGMEDLWAHFIQHFRFFSFFDKSCMSHNKCTWSNVSHMFFISGITLRPSDVTVKRTYYRRKTTNEEMKEINNYAMLALFPYIQGDQKFVPPLPGRDEKSSGKTENSIFKYNLFKYYLENFEVYNQLFTSQWLNEWDQSCLILLKSYPNRLKGVEIRFWVS